MLVFPIPNVDLRSVVSEELHHLQKILQSGAVHGGLPVGIGRSKGSDSGPLFNW
jgi:hypothetical protein